METYEDDIRYYVMVFTIGFVFGCCSKETKGTVASRKNMQNMGVFET